MPTTLMGNLLLDEVQTSGLNLIPTEKLFKPVIVMRCPMTQAIAARLNGDWLYGQDGLPHPFGGTIKLPMEISSPTITISPALGESLIVKTQRIGKFNCTLSEEKTEDGDTSIELTMRIHLPPVDVAIPDDLERLINTIRCLAALNKSKFGLMLQPQQATLFGNDGGPASKDGASELVFTGKFGRKPGINGIITIKPEGSGWLAGWEVKAIGLEDTPAGGQAMNPEVSFGTEELARTWAAGEILHFLKFDLKVEAPAEIKAVGLMTEWCLVHAPSLRKQPTLQEATQ